MVPVSRCVYMKAWPFFSSLISSPTVPMRDEVCVSLEVGKGDAKCVSGVPMRNFRSGGGGERERHKSMTVLVLLIPVGARRVRGDVVVVVTSSSKRQRNEAVGGGGVADSKYSGGINRL